MDVRIAILADVHANLAAGEAVLADIEGQQVDRVIVNGDLVNRGPDSAAVMELLSPYRADSTLGNHDDVMLMIADKRDIEIDPWYMDPFWKSTRMAAEEVRSRGLLDAIRALPMTIRVEPPGAPSLLISHGSPRHYREGYGTHVTPEMISEITEEYPADVLIGSHTHRPHLVRWGRYTVLNTGAVGAPFTGDPRAHYLIVTLENGYWRPEFRRVPYDRQRSIDAFSTSGLLDAGGLSARIFLEELKHARSYMVPFLMWCEEEKLERNERQWQEFQRLRSQRFVLPTEPTSVYASAAP